MAQLNRMATGDRSQDDPALSSADSGGGRQDAGTATASARLKTADGTTAAALGMPDDAADVSPTADPEQVHISTRVGGGAAQKKPAAHPATTQPSNEDQSGTTATGAQPQMMMQAAAQAIPDAGTTRRPDGSVKADGAREAGTTDAASRIGAQGSAKESVHFHAQPETDAAALGQAATTDAPTADLPPGTQQLSPMLLQPVVTQDASSARPIVATGGAAGDTMQAGGNGAEATPTAQVAAPVVKLLQATDGSSSLSVSLHPKDLGEVKIRLDRDAEGSVRVVVAATEPGTLRSLMADQSHLHAALDAASLPAGDRQFSFELANGSTATAGGQENTAQAGSGDSDQRRGGQQTPQDQRSSAAWNTDRGDQPATLPAFMTTRAASYRAGVNITA